MKICENGHSYDETQFATCPICYAQGLTGASSGAQQEIVRDENGGYYDKEGNYIDAAGNKYIPAPQGGFYDEAGGYYDVSGNYYPPAYQQPAQQAAPTATYQQPAQSAAPAYNAAQPGAYVDPNAVPPAGKAPKKPKTPGGKKKKIIIIIAAVAAVLIGVGVWFFFLRSTESTKKGEDGITYMTRDGDTFMLNSYSGKTNSIIPPGFLMYSSDAKKISFLYNDSCTISDEKNVVYINLSADNSEYIELSYKSGKTTPKKYFNKFKSQVKKQYGADSQMSDIMEVNLINNEETGVHKNGYVMSCEVTDNGRTLYLDRYLMVYKDNYVEATVYVYSPKAGDEVVYRVLSSFYTRSNGFDPYEEGSTDDYPTTQSTDYPTTQSTDYPTTEYPTTEYTTQYTTEYTTQATTEYTTQYTTEYTTQATTEATTSTTGGNGTVTAQGGGVTVILPESMLPNGWEEVQGTLNLYVLPDTKDTYMAITYMQGGTDEQEVVKYVFDFFAQNAGGTANMGEMQTTQGVTYTFYYSMGTISNNQGSIGLVAVAVKSASGKVYAIYFLTDDAHLQTFIDAFNALMNNIYLD